MYNILCLNLLVFLFIHRKVRFVVYSFLLSTEQLKSISVDHKSLQPFQPRGLINRGNMCYVHTVS